MAFGMVTRIGLLHPTNR